MSKNKKLIFKDYNEIPENVDFNNPKSNLVTMISKKTGKVLFKKRKNKVIIGGSELTALSHFSPYEISEGDFTTPSYDAELGLTKPVGVIESTSRPFICLFAIGIDGAGTAQHEIKKVEFSKRLSHPNIIPFKMPLSAYELTNYEKEMYHGIHLHGGRRYYYFKAFDTKPALTMKHISDDSDVGSDVYSNPRVDEIEVKVTCRMGVGLHDARDWFVHNEGINHARFNTISLLFANEVRLQNGDFYYDNIRPATKVNFANTPLNDENEGVDIIYELYY